MAFDYDVQFQLSPLQAAAWRGEKAEVEQLLAASNDANADVNAVNPAGDTALHRVAFPYIHAQVGRDLQIDIARLLLEAGANVTASNKREITALHHAALWGYDQLAELLLAWGAEVDARTTEGFTPLHRAATGGHVSLAELLLSRGAQVDAQSQHGLTPLHLAVARGRVGTLGLLLQGGANANLPAVFGGEGRLFSSEIPEATYTPLALITALMECSAVKQQPEEKRQRDEACIQAMAELLREHGHRVVDVPVETLSGAAFRVVTATVPAPPERGSEPSNDSSDHNRSMRIER